MLLYTRVAAPKVPKKRSRAGCVHCKDKKKKCDETRPRCSRCVEHGEECLYEAVKPRQRRKRDSVASLSLNSDLYSRDESVDGTVQTPRSGIFDNDCQGWLADFRFGAPSPGAYSQLAPLSAKSVDDGMFPWTPQDLPALSPGASGIFDLSSLGETPLQEDDDVEEVIRRDSALLPVTASHAHHSPSLALIAPIPTPSPRLEFHAPVYAEFSSRPNRRALVDHFCNVLSHLIVFREENGNPFQQLVLPLSHKSPAVMDAIYALASAHLEVRGVENGERSVWFHNQAIQGLARLIEQGGDVNKNELLAAIMLLVYYEVLVQKGRSNIVDGHLKGAMSIMGNSLARTDPAGVFLERAFRFYDVIAALSFGTAPLSSSPGRGSFAPFPPLDSRGATSPVGSVDALLGMATSLWPVIHRLSNLLGLKDELDAATLKGEGPKMAVLRAEFESTASAIEVALQQWKPTLPADSILARDPEDLPAEMATERGRLQSILNNALAYQHSAFVYLYRTIYGRPRNHPIVQRHTHISLTHCVATVSNAGPMGALLWPLFVAACEAQSLGDRDLARQAFAAIDRRQGMINIERAWCIVEEVWRRADGEERERLMAREEEEEMGGDLWRRVSKDMGVTVVFG